MPDSLHIETFILGDWQTNCYVLHAKPAADSTSPTPCWIIDASFEPFKLIQYIKRSNLAPQAVWLTHAHVDHIAGLPDLRRHWPDIPILIHRAEREFLTDPMLNLSAFLPEPMVVPEATGTFAHGDILDAAGLKCEVRHTPGHSPGGVTFYFKSESVAIVGDTLFKDSVGRTDFPTSDQDAMFRSIREQLLSMLDDTRVLPGHGPATTIGRERRSNPFLGAPSR